MGICCVYAAWAAVIIVTRQPRMNSRPPSPTSGRLDDLEPGLDDGHTPATDDDPSRDRPSPRARSRFLPADPRPLAPSLIHGPTEPAFHFPGIPTGMSLNDYARRGMEDLRLMLVQEHRRSTPPSTPEAGHSPTGDED